MVHAVYQSYTQFELILPIASVRIARHVVTSLGLFFGDVCRMNSNLVQSFGSDLTLMCDGSLFTLEFTCLRAYAR